MYTNETRDMFDGLDATKLSMVISVLGDLFAGQTTIEKIQTISEILNDNDLYGQFPGLVLNKVNFGDVNNVDKLNTMLLSMYVNIATAYKYGDLLNKAAVYNYNSAMTSYGKVTDELNKLKKNLAAFDIYNKTKTGAKMHLESFRDVSTIDFNYPVEKDRLLIDTNAGLVTLPRDGETSAFLIEFDSIKISGNSNGSLGTSVSRDGFTHSNLKTLFDNDQTTWIEYERVSPVAFSEQLDLEMTLTMSSGTVVNCLSAIFYPVNGQYPEVEDISVSLNGITYESVFKDSELKSWLDAPGNSAIRQDDQGVYTAYFMPQKARFLRVKFKQNKQYLASRPTTGTVYRQVIAIKEIQAYSIKYKPEGEIITKKIETESAYNAIGLYSNDLTYNSKFASLEYFLTKDDGQSWTPISPIDEESDLTEEIIPFDNLSSQLRTKIRMKRDPKGFSNTTVNKTDDLVTYTQTARMPTAAPFKTLLDQPPADDNIFIGVIGMGSIGQDGNFYLERNVATQVKKFNLNTTTTFQHTLSGSYASNGSISLATPNGGDIDYAKATTYTNIVVTNIDTSYVYEQKPTASFDYSVNRATNSIVFAKNSTNATNYIPGANIEVTYNEIINGTLDEYVVSLPYPMLARKVGKYLVYVDGTLYTEKSYSSTFTADFQYKIRYGTNEISFSNNIAGQDIKIVIQDEVPQFPRSAPHNHTLEVTGNGIQSELYCKELLQVEDVSKPLPTNIVIFELLEDDIIPDSIAVTGLVSGTDFVFDEDTKLVTFTVPVTGSKTITYSYLKTKTASITYTDHLYNTVNISGKEFSSRSYSQNHTLTSNSLSVVINLGSANYLTYNIVPSILDGTVTVTDSGGVNYFQVQYINGSDEFERFSSGDKVFSVNLTKGTFYFKTTPVLALTIAFEYTKYRIGYGFSIQVDNKFYEIQNEKELVFKHEFISKVLSESDSRDRTMSIRYNVRGANAATLAELEKFYSPYIFDFSLVFGR